MNFSWLSVFILAIIAVAVSAGKCKAPFKKEGPNCVVDRVIRGECPHGSQFSANINKCVYKN
ncbi:uncharacterized protein Dana_GF19743 [Drosophila ananassae]|uniref:Chitin-binding type-2 domain-containing protein n=1 Tax=Drosophila ananassae TaxID=7217 RepID=B3N1M3_DROAN|nr:uncharacterized protein LOC6502489 [Drosophila ananassae]EDV33992.1 uncharacterized protein Dana_GF19743 [Drosophila ananassae]